METAGELYAQNTGSIQRFWLDFSNTAILGTFDGIGFATNLILQNDEEWDAISTLAAEIKKDPAGFIEKVGAEIATGFINDYERGDYASAFGRLSGTGVDLFLGSKGAGAAGATVKNAALRFVNRIRPEPVDAGIVWKRGNHAQGTPWEKFLDANRLADLGENLNDAFPNHPVFDYAKLASGKIIATSAKTMDTITPSRIAHPKYVGYTINKMVRDVVGYSESSIGIIEIGNKTVVRRIELAIPSGTTTAQWKIINDKITWAASQGVALVVTKVQ